MIAEACFDDPECIDACAGAVDEATRGACEDQKREAFARRWRAGAGAPAAPPPPPSPSAETPVIHGSDAPLDTVTLAARARPAVVAVRAGDRLGTGFGMNEAGWVATNYHVVAGAERITVRGADRAERRVEEVIAFDAARDLALLRVEPPFPVLVLDPRDRPAVGEPVLAIGNPLGLEFTVSNGIVSGLRTLGAVELLQVTAPISPGSSGGPVLDPHGAVLGISTFTLAKGQNLNFAVPARYLRELSRSPRPMTLAAFAAASRADAPAAEHAGPPRHLRLVRGTPGAEVVIVREDRQGKKTEKRVGETQWTRPVDLDVPAGERWTILARAPGHEDFEHEVVFGRGVVDMKLVIELRRRTP